MEFSIDNIDFIVEEVQGGYEVRKKGEYNFFARVSKMGIPQGQSHIEYIYKVANDHIGHAKNNKYLSDLWGFTKGDAT